MMRNNSRAWCAQQFGWHIILPLGPLYKLTCPGVHKASQKHPCGFPRRRKAGQFGAQRGKNEKETTASRSSSREVGIRVPTFVCFVYFSRGTQPNKLVRKGTTRGPRIVVRWLTFCPANKMDNSSEDKQRQPSPKGSGHHYGPFLDPGAAWCHHLKRIPKRPPTFDKPELIGQKTGQTVICHSNGPSPKSA